MFDVITFGGATQDVYLMSRKFRVVRDPHFLTGQAECFAFGTKVELDDVHFEVGGGATNSAVTFARQGFKTAVVAKVGHDSAGVDVGMTMKEYGVATDFIAFDWKRPTAYATIFLTATGERTVLVYRGAGDNLRSADIPWSKLKAKWFYVSSLAGNLPLLRRIVATAKRTKTRVAVNPGGKELERRAALPRILRDVDVLLLNRVEATTLYGIPLRDDRRLIASLKQRRRGITVVTEGEKGSWVWDGQHIYRIGIHPVKAIDTTGAGDAYGSGFVAGLLKRPGDITRALRLATANAASTVQEIGAKHGLVSRRLPSKKRWLHVHIRKVA